MYIGVFFFYLSSFSATLYMWCVCVCVCVCVCMCVSIDGEEDKAKRSKGKGRYDKIGGGSKIYLEIGSSPATAPSVGEECSLAGWLDQPRTAASSDPWGGSERMEGRKGGRKEGRNTLGSEARRGTARDLEIRDCTLTSPASQPACLPTKRRTHRYGRAQLSPLRPPLGQRCVGPVRSARECGPSGYQVELRERERERGGGGGHPIRCTDFCRRISSPPPLGRRKKHVIFLTGEGQKHARPTE